MIYLCKSVYLQSYVNFSNMSLGLVLDPQIHLLICKLSASMPWLYQGLPKKPWKPANSKTNYRQRQLPTNKDTNPVQGAGESYFEHTLLVHYLRSLWPLDYMRTHPLHGCSGCGGGTKGLI